MNDRISGCLLGGAIGDAFGGIEERGRLCLSDDTQLTLATCESISQVGRVDPEHLAATFLSWFADRRLVGLGSSTLKALRDLQAGAHWALAGARGEMAAGNGGAMRIAPLAFMVDVLAERQLIRDVVRITHHSDEAYLGALGILVALQNPGWIEEADLLLRVADALPDCRVRDQLRLVAGDCPGSSLKAVAVRHGCGGYVVETVPIALLAAQRILSDGFRSVLDALGQAGGDTDTIGSLAGQLAGTAVGSDGLPADLLGLLPERDTIVRVASDFAAVVGAANPEVTLQ